MRTSTFCLALAFVTLGAALIGCGGSGDGVFTPGTTGGAVPNPYRGSYSAATTLDGGKVGTTSLTVDADGRAVGTLKVEAGSAPITKYSFSVGVFDIAGTVDPETGEFTMTGNIPAQGPFSYSGVLPGNGRVGSYIITAGGQTWSGTFGSGGTTGGSTNGSTNASTDGSTNGSTNGNNTTTTGTTSGTIETFDVGTTHTLQASANSAEDSKGNALDFSFLSAAATDAFISHSVDNNIYGDNATIRWYTGQLGTSPIYAVSFAYAGQGASTYRTGTFDGPAEGFNAIFQRVGGSLPNMQYFLVSGTMTVTKATQRTYAASFQNAVFEPAVTPSFGKGRFTLNGTVNFE